MIAISATDKKLNTSMDLRFGKAPYFYITNGTKSRFIVNPFCQEEENIAPRVVEMLKNENVTKIITGEIGPKAYSYLQQYNIQIIMLNEERINIGQVLKKFQTS